MRRLLSESLAAMLLVATALAGAAEVSATPAPDRAGDLQETPVCYRTESASATMTFAVDMFNSGETWTATQGSEFTWRDSTQGSDSPEPIVVAYTPVTFPEGSTLRGWARVTAPDGDFQQDDELWWTLNSTVKRMAVGDFPRECADDEPGLPPTGGGPGGPDGSDGSDVEVVPDCYYSAQAQPKTGDPVQYVLTATNTGSTGPEFETSFAWSAAPPDTLDVNVDPAEFPSDTPVKSVVTVVPAATTVDPAGQLTWTIGVTQNVFQASAFTSLCADAPLPSSGSSATAVIVISMLVPVALLGGYILLARRRKGSSPA